jgi:hypothetical protein
MSFATRLICTGANSHELSHDIKSTPNKELPIKKARQINLAFGGAKNNA